MSLSDRRSQRTWTQDVAAFLITECPVTIADSADYDSADYDSTSRVLADADSGTGRRPVTDVTWWDALRYCNALSVKDGLPRAYSVDESREAVTWDHETDGYRLPTEAEWEYACRAGTSGPRYGVLDDIAWYRHNSGEHLHDVATKAPNPWGLYDTLGNVWEWCWDLYDPHVYGAYRVLRGGGWFDEHWSCRASVRRRGHPTWHIDDVGFRLARSRSDR